MAEPAEQLQAAEQQPAVLVAELVGRKACRDCRLEPGSGLGRQLRREAEHCYWPLGQAAPHTAGRQQALVRGSVQQAR